MGRYYQRLDEIGFDYKLCTYPGLTGPVYRGPRSPDEPCVLFLGGAQTFGRFCHRPFPDLVGERLALPTRNLGFGSAGPRHYLRAEYRPFLESARAVVLQVMSGRSTSNSVIQNSHAALQMNGCMRAWRRDDGSECDLWRLIGDLLRRRDRRAAEELVREAREDYMAEMTRLIESIGAPVVLLWISDRDPDYVPDFGSVDGVFASYPHLVDRDMLEVLERRASRAVRVGPRGLPQPLWPSFVPVDGTTLRDGVLYNEYYPSPEMHADAAAALIPVLEGIA